MIGAKLVTAALVGVGFGLTVAVLGGSAVAASILSAGGSLDLAANEVPRVVGGTIAAYGVYTMIGVGVGALVRNQVAAVVACLLWVFMVEPAFMVVPNEVVQTIGSWMRVSRSPRSTAPAAPTSGSTRASSSRCGWPPSPWWGTPSWPPWPLRSPRPGATSPDPVPDRPGSRSSR